MGCAGYDNTASSADSRWVSGTDPLELTCHLEEGPSV